jgi:hypothetical protein
VSAPPIKRIVFNCLNKRRFSDEYAARAATQARLQQIGEKDGLAVYRCPECSGWHMTSRHSRRYWRVTDTEVYPTLKGATP